MSPGTSWVPSAACFTSNLQIHIKIKKFILFLLLFQRRLVNSEVTKIGDSYKNILIWLISQKRGLKIKFCFNSPIFRPSAHKSGNQNKITYKRGVQIIRGTHFLGGWLEFSTKRSLIFSL